MKFSTVGKRKMKKLIINALGIVSVLTMLIMVVVKVVWTEKPAAGQVSNISNQVNEIKAPKNNLALMCDRIDHLSDNVRNIKPQNTDACIEPDNSRIKHRHQFDESLFEDSYAYDPNDYPGEDSFDRKNNNRKINGIENYKEAKAADVIE